MAFASKAVWVRKVREEEEERPSYCKRPTDSLFARELRHAALPAEQSILRKRERGSVGLSQIRSRK